MYLTNVSQTKQSWRKGQTPGDNEEQLVWWKQLEQHLPKPPERLQVD